MPANPNLLTPRVEKEIEQLIQDIDTTTPEGQRKLITKLKREFELSPPAIAGIIEATHGKQTF